MLPQQYCLRWRYHHSNLQTMFSQLLEREAFCDVTLACEGRTIKAHKIVLSACSTYFETILSQYEEKDPILIMKDVKYVDIKCLVEFMYKGEINVDHCHLATLLKTAEELKIKGLAEVSWRDEDQQNIDSNNVNGVQTALPQVSTVMDNPKVDTPSNKRKRGRPPIDDYEQAFTAPKIMNVTGNADETYSNDAMSTSDHDLSIWEEDPSANEAGDTTEPDEPSLMTVKKETSPHDDDVLIDDSGDQFSPTDSKHDNSSRTGSTKSVTNVTTSGTQSFLTPALEKEWPDVIKMNDYLNTGRRQQFWEEPFTKRVMDAIKTKNLEMKVAAELLGVSYGTLYGRYRDSYGCLKHPYRDYYGSLRPIKRLRCSNDFYFCCKKRNNTPTLNTCKPRDTTPTHQIAEFPWMVAIYKKTSKWYSYKCGGTLIHPKVVLTAQHCITSSSANSLQIATKSKNHQPSSNRKKVSKIIENPNYHSETLHNDVALLILEEAVTETPPLCLAQSGQSFRRNNCMVATWGRNRRLHKVGVDIVEAEQCETRLQNTILGEKFRLHDSTLCASTQTGRISKGDGGAPLFCVEDGHYVQAGIVSWGLIRENSYFPHLYANVTTLRVWIDRALMQEHLMIF